MTDNPEDWLLRMAARALAPDLIREATDYISEAAEEVDTDGLPEHVYVFAGAAAGAATAFDATVVVS